MPSGPYSKPLVWEWWDRALRETRTFRPHLTDADVETIALGLLAAIYAESGGRTDAVGDNGHSVGLFQMHDQGAGAGLSVAQRQNPDIQFRHARHIILSLEEELYWSRVENRGFNPGLAIQRIQRSIDSRGDAYNAAYRTLLHERGR